MPVTKEKIRGGGVCLRRRKANVAVTCCTEGVARSEQGGGREVWEGCETGGVGPSGGNPTNGGCPHWAVGQVAVADGGGGDGSRRGDGRARTLVMTSMPKQSANSSQRLKKSMWQHMRGSRHAEEYQFRESR